uniref:Uncharacterized protein n=1 Tax=Globodera rostochiensis TaxID=31243 RepID=A0A914I4B5_GLORO
MCDFHEPAPVNIITENLRPMSLGLPMLLLRRLLSVLLALFSTVYKLISCRFFRRHENRIGELPFVVPSAEKAQNATAAADWDIWKAEPTAVADQIAEYRRQKQEEAAKMRAKRPNQRHSPRASLEPSSPHEADLFTELQPNVKAPKKLLLRPKQSKQRNLFAVQPTESGFPVEVGRLDELGDLDFEQPTKSSSWLDDEESLELCQIDAVEREQRRSERERRHKARLAEHAAVLHQKQLQQQQQQHNHLAAATPTAGSNECHQGVIPHTPRCRNYYPSNSSDWLNSFLRLWLDCFCYALWLMFLNRSACIINHSRRLNRFICTMPIMMQQVAVSNSGRHILIGIIVKKLFNNGGKATQFETTFITTSSACTFVQRVAHFPHMTVAEPWPFEC